MKRKVLKPWIERLLTYITVLFTCIIGAVQDFPCTLYNTLIWFGMCGIIILNVFILHSYGRGVVIKDLEKL